MIPLYPRPLPTQNGKFVDKVGALALSSYDFLKTLWNRTGGQSGNPIVVTNGLAATGSGQSDALALTQDWSEVLTTPAGTGVVLMDGMQPGQLQKVFNGGANPLNVYPPSGSKINALGINAPFSLAANKQQDFQLWSIPPTVANGQFRTVTLG